MTRPGLDVLAWPAEELGARLQAGAVQVERPWGVVRFRPAEPLASGWWSLLIDAPAADLFEIAFRNRDRGERLSLTARGGEARVLFWTGGRPELTLQPPGRPDRRALKGLRLWRLGLAERLGLFLSRAWAAVKRDGPGRLLVAAGYLASRTRDGVALRPAAGASEGAFAAADRAEFAARLDPVRLAERLAAVADGPRFIVRLAEGGDPAGLRAQHYRRWEISDRPAAPDEVSLTLDAGDELFPDALLVAAETFKREPERQALYADEVVDGVATAKPAWDPELALRLAYTGGPVFLRGDVPRDGECGHARLLALHRLSGPSAVGRIPLPLLRRGSPRAPAGGAFRAVVERHLAEERPPTAELHPLAGGFTIRRRLPTPAPRVSAVVPTRDQPALLEACLSSLIERTDYPDLEVVVVDNGSRTLAARGVLDAWAAHPRCRVLRVDEPFNFSRLCNAGVRASTGEVVALVNDDVEATDPQWLSLMVAEVLRPDVGAVGPLLTYPDGSVQHAGIALGVFGSAGHPWRGRRPCGDVDPRVVLPGLRSAVTGACLVVRREAYERAGGLDETRFPVTLNDVDLCLKLGALGMNILYLPTARLVHHEGRSRKPDAAAENRERRRREIDAFLQTWRPQVDGDPYYSPQMSVSSEAACLR